MFNWRRPMLDFYDRSVARSAQPEHFATMQYFYGLSAEERRRIQSERLSRLLKHAARHVPYYREILDKHSVVSGEKVDLAAFQHLPELTRTLLREQFDALKSDDLASRDWYKNSSGGSTGEPVLLLQDRDYEALSLTVLDMHHSWAGRASGESMVKLWGSDRDILLGTLGWRNNFSNFIRNKTFLNSFKMSRSYMQRYVEKIQRVRPVMIEAYAESIYELARYMNESNIKISGVRNIVTTAGTLYPFIREEVERAFQCPILNRYGCREVGSFAGERTAGAGLEVFTYTHWVEVVDENGRACQPGEEGDVLVTCLTNYAMPIIRYRIGDCAVVGAAIDKPTASVEALQTVTGRTLDAFVRADGTTVPGMFFMYFLSVFFKSSWIKKFQVVQRDYDDVLIKVVQAAPPPQGALDDICAALGRVLGAACKIDFEFVESIAAQPSGKYRYMMSQVTRS